MRSSLNLAPYAVAALFGCPLAYLLSGCSHSDPCATLKQQGIDSFTAEALAREAQRCLTPDENGLLSRATPLIMITQGEGKTVGEIINEQRGAETTAQSIQLPSLPDAQVVPSPSAAPNAGPPTDQFSSSAELVQKSAVFIYEGNGDGGVNEDAPEATGFIVSVPSKKDASRHILLLLTSRHVVDPEWAKCGRSNPDRLYISMNKRPKGSTEGARVGYEPISLSSPSGNTYRVPGDNSIDAAVILLPPKSIAFKDYDVQFVPMPMFATDSEIASIRVNSPLVTAGLVVSAGKGTQSHNDPAFESGYLSAKTTDKLINAYCDSNFAKPVKVWLIAPALEPGFSGAPIFAPVTRMFRGKKTKGPVLVGMQSMRLGRNDPGGMTTIVPIVQTIEELVRPWPEADVIRGFH